MYQRVFVLVAVAVTSVTCQSCTSNLSGAEFRQLYCNSDLVFQGTGTMSPGGTLQYRDGSMGSAKIFKFSASNVYKGSPTDRTDMSIASEWIQDVSPCSQTRLPPTDGDYIFFANGTGTDLNTRPCDSVFASTCIPADIRDSLILGSITCSSP